MPSGRLFGDFGPVRDQPRPHSLCGRSRVTAQRRRGRSRPRTSGRRRQWSAFTATSRSSTPSPEAPAKPARTLLIDVPNRGRRLSFSMFNRARPDDLLADPCAPRRRLPVRTRLRPSRPSAGNGASPPALALRRRKRAWMTLRSQATVICRVQPGSNRPFVSFGQLGDVAYPPASFSSEGKPLAHPRAEGSSSEGKPLAHPRAEGSSSEGKAPRAPPR